MTTRAKVERRKRAPARVSVGPETEFTDFHGLLKLFGIRRSLAYHLVEVGAIKSISLKEKSEKRGKRLFYVLSVRQYLNARLRAAE
jgi:hypothetical protein